MEINNVMTQSHHEFIERLGQTIQEHHDTEQQALLTDFADLYFKRLALAEFQGRRYKDIYGFVAGWWQLIANYQARAGQGGGYQPNLYKDG